MATTTQVIDHLKSQGAPADWIASLEVALTPVANVDSREWATSIACARHYGVTLPSAAHLGDASEADMLGYISTIGTILEKG